MMNSKTFDGIDAFTVLLANDEMADFRPVKPRDGQIIQNGMYALSEKSRYFRFFSPIAKLSEEQIHYFSEVDQRNHVAWIALAHDRIGLTGIGIARFIRLQPESDIAEFAVTVIDRYQKLGVGTMLMSVLYMRARALDIKILRGFVLPENSVAIRWFERLGAGAKFENGVCLMDIVVHQELSSIPMPPLLQYFVEHQDRVISESGNKSGID